MNIIKYWNNRVIRFRNNGEEVCLTDLANATGKQCNDWLRLKGTQDYLEAFSTVTGIPVTELLQVLQGGIPEEQGTWAHRRVAIRFAQWCSPKLAVTIDGWVEELLLTGKVDLNNTPKAVNTHKQEVLQVLAEVEQRLGKKYGDEFFLANYKVIHNDMTFPELKPRQPLNLQAKEEILLAKIFKKAQYQGSITPRQVQQNFTNRSRKLSIDNARAYLRKLCEMGLGYIDSEGTFVPHIDDEIMTQLAQ